MDEVAKRAPDIAYAYAGSLFTGGGGTIKEAGLSDSKGQTRGRLPESGWVHPAVQSA